jgi:hypothetical protein
MDRANQKILDDFEIGWGTFRRSTILNFQGVNIILSALRRKFSIEIDPLSTRYETVAFLADFSAVKIGLSRRTLLVLLNAENGKVSDDAFKNFRICYHTENPGDSMVLVFVDDTDKDFSKRCEKSNLDVAVLNYESIRALLASEDWAFSLAEVLRSRKSSYELNPFDEVGVCSPEMFVGRRRELHTMQSHMRAHGIAVVGCRRVGKSSLLLRLKDCLDKQGQQSYYIDCQACRSPESFYQEIVKRTNMHDLQHMSRWSLKDYLIRLCARETRQVNLFFDEFDPVISADQESDFASIAELISAQNNTSGKLRFWMAGYKDLLSAATDYGHPLFGKLRVVEISPLTLEETSALISIPFNHLGYSLENPQEIIRRIYGETAGHPALTQLYCRLLVETLADEETTITDVHLDTVCQSNEFLEYVLNTFILNTSALEKMLVLSVLDKTTFSQFEAYNQLLSRFDIDLSYAVLYKELNDLRFGGVLFRKGECYSFLYPIMTRVIREFGNPDYIVSQYLSEARRMAESFNEREKKAAS